MALGQHSWSDLKFGAAVLLLVAILYASLMIMVVGPSNRQFARSEASLNAISQKSYEAFEEKEGITELTLNQRPMASALYDGFATYKRGGKACSAPYRDIHSAAESDGYWHYENIILVALHEECTSP